MGWTESEMSRMGMGKEVLKVVMCTEEAFILEGLLLGNVEFPLFLN